MRSLKMIILAIVFLFSTDFASAEWIRVDDSFSGEKIYYNTEGIERYTNFVRVWTRATNLSGDNLQSESQMDFNLTKMHTRFYLIKLTKVNGDTTTIYASDVGEFKWSPASPDSISAVLWRACSKL